MVLNFKQFFFRKFIKREKSLMSAGSKWYVIPQQWWLSWIEHTTCCDDDMLSLNNFTVGVNKTGVPVMKGYERNVKGSASVQNSPLAQRKKAKVCVFRETGLSNLHL